MYNICDYLDWRGDLPVAKVPLCEVDLAILSALVYSDFESLEPEDVQGETLHQLLEKYGDKLCPSPSSDTRKEIGALWLKLDKYPRLASAVLDGFESHFEEESVNAAGQARQFAAATFVFEGEGGLDAAVVFRGTDSTIVGWREDFAMGYEERVPAQVDAAAYLNEALKTYERVYVCGHSKGGNLALYAAAHAEDALRVKAVYNFDGPGLTDAVLATDTWHAVAPVTHTLVPESSVFGMIMGHNQPREIMDSDSASFLQHSMFKWHVLGPSFVRVEERTASSDILARSFAEWTSNTPAETRETLADAMFKIAQECDAQVTEGLLMTMARKLPGMIKKGNLFTEEEIDALKAFIGCLKKGGADGIGARLPEISLPDISLPELPLPSWFRRDGKEDFEEGESEQDGPTKDNQDSVGKPEK